ncbi:MAG: hypothetical protein ACR2JE_13040 [Acidobacteriaceae bacterium]
MATPSYESALRLAESLSRDEQLRLIQELTTELSAHAEDALSSEPAGSLLDLCGLGREIWQTVDAQEYVNGERASWIG